MRPPGALLGLFYEVTEKELGGNTSGTCAFPTAGVKLVVI